MRHGRKSRSKTFHGFKEHCVLDLDRTVTRAGVVRPAHAPEYAVVERVADALESGPGLLQLDSDLGDMASPRMAQWAAQGVDILARPWPQGGVLCTQEDCTLDFAHGAVTCPNGHTVPMVPGKNAQFPASTCATCPMRTQCTTARMGHGRRLTIRADGPRCAHVRPLNMRSPIHWRTKDGAPATRVCGKTRVMAVVMQQ